MKLFGGHFRATAAGSVLLIWLSAILPTANSQHPDLEKPRPDAEAYQSVLPQVSAPQLKKLQTEMNKLRALSEDVQAKLERAPKQSGFDLKSLQDEFRKLIQEPDFDKRNKGLDAFHQRYEQAFAQQAAAAGVDLGAERDRMASLLGLSATELPPGFAADSRNLGIARVPPTMSVAEERPPSTVQNSLVDYFRPPYTGGATRGTDDILARALARPAEGYLEVNTTTLVLGGTQTFAFLTQNLAVRSGTRVLRVAVELDEFYYYAGVSSLLGGASAEGFVTLRLLDGSRVTTCERRSLGRTAVATFGSSRTYISGPTLNLTCRMDRPPANLTMVVEFEGAVGVIALGSTSVVIAAKPRRFTVTSEL
jgi:hypothetical protein